MASTDFAYQIAGYGLTTVPSFNIWQDDDLAPCFPELNRFLAF